MKVERLDRVYVYVRDLRKAIGFFSDLLGTNFSEPMALNDVGMISSYSPTGLVLASPSSPDSHVARTIERRGEGVSIVAFKVTDIEEAAAHFASRGVRLAQRFSLGGIGNVEGAVHHPKDAYGVQIDLNQYKEESPMYIALQKK